MSRHFILAIFLLFSINSDAQWLLGFHTDYDDTFREWNFEVEIDSATIEEGQLDLTWAFEDDFTQWQYSFGDHSGDIIQKFPNNPGLWELRSDQGVVTMKQSWPRDFTQWTISYQGQSFEIRLKRGYSYSWENSKEENGELFITQEYIGDSRDWIIEDYMNDDIPFVMKFAATFIAIFTSSPKN